MKRIHEKIQYNWFLLVCSVTIGFVFIVFFLMLSDLNHTIESRERFELLIQNEMKKDVRNEVKSRIDEIQYDLNNLTQEERNINYENVHMVKELLLNQDILNITQPDLRRVAAIQAYENITSIDNYYSYFLFDRNGILLKTGSDVSIEGSDMLDVKDRDGVYFAREMLRAIDQVQGVYVTYYFPKTTGGQPLKKTSYCLYIPELDLILGSGTYEEDVEKELKKQTFSRLQSYYQDTEDYIFVVGYDGIAHVFGDPKMIGQNTIGVKDINGLEIHSAFIETLQENGEGFLTYNYFRKGQNEVSEKTSYVKAIDRWDAYIGMGYHTDDLNEELDKYTEEFRIALIKKTLYLVGILVLLTLIVLVFIRRGFVLHKKFMKQEDVVFEQLFQLSEEGILIISNESDVLYTNPMIQKMMGKVHRNYIDIDGKLLLQEEADQIYKLESPSGRDYFVTVKEEQIIYLNKDSQIYFISDVTERYIQSNELKRIALLDELTKLPNRRKLLNDYEDLLDQKKNLNSVVLGVVDIDEFKKVNDAFGHNTGDQVLVLLGECFNRRLREENGFYRLGGEEFVVLFRNIDLESAREIVLEINNTFKNECFKSISKEITFSGGLVNVMLKDEDKQTFDYNFKMADKLLYQAKHTGRNRIESILKSE